MSYAAINALEAVIEQLNPSQQNFARDLIRKGRRHGLSGKQLYWVERLTREAGQPPKQRESVGDLSGVLALFERAKQHLKSPAIVLHIAEVGEVRVSVAGERARVPGSLNVADNAPYGVGRWFGRILRDGSFDESNRCDVPATLLPALRNFAERPSEVAAEHGRLTGKCCFCNIPLTDERSTAVGYGRTCAKNYGLPWGAKAAARCERTDEMFACIDPGELRMMEMDAAADREGTVRDETAKHAARAAMESGFRFGGWVNR